MPSQNDVLFKGSLITLTLMILGMGVIGGLTRLTGSGLSIVEWKPLTGIFPPLTLTDWILEFSKYQQSPEFQKVTFGITLADFQSIFWLEYIHRLWGRLLGVILLIPTYLMIFKKQYRDLWPLLTFMWLLGVAQGGMGWLMVKSGLHHDPHVSPYRLSGHLFLGFSIFGIALWMTLGLYGDTFRIDLKGFSKKSIRSLRKLSLIALSLVLLTAFWGALTAGHRAGLLYNTFPFMGETFVPHEFLTLSPWQKDLLENPVSIQFLHRLLALATVFFFIGIWIYQRTLLIPPALSHAFAGLALAGLCQLLLGILTLLFIVPLSFALLHQAFAFILFGSLIYVLFLLFHVKTLPYFQET